MKSKRVLHLSWRDLLFYNVWNSEWVVRFTLTELLSQVKFSFIAPGFSDITSIHINMCPKMNVIRLCEMAVRLKLLISVPYKNTCVYNISPPVVTLKTWKNHCINLCFRDCFSFGTCSKVYSHLEVLKVRRHSYD